MYKKIVLGLGALAVVASLAIPVTRVENYVPFNPGSTIFTWNYQISGGGVDYRATTSRTVAVAAGALLLAFILPEKKRR